MNKGKPAMGGSPTMDPSIEARILKIEDELAIRNLAAQFSDAIARLDYEGFRSVWAHNAVWEINKPLCLIASGADSIVALLHQLIDGRDVFVQLTHSGVVYIDGNTAVARWIMRERGRGPGDLYYDNFAVYLDTLVKLDGQWRFANRKYHYVFLDDSEFSGRSFPRPL